MLTGNLLVAFGLLLVVAAALAGLVRYLRSDRNRDQGRLPRPPAGADLVRPADAPTDVAAEQARRIVAEAETVAAARAETARAEAQSLVAAAEQAATAAGTRAEREHADLAAEIQRLQGRRGELEADAAAQRAEVLRRAEEADRRDARVLERETRLDGELARLADREQAQTARAVELDGREADLAQAEQQRQAELERVAELTAAQARTELVAAIESQAKREAA